MVLGVADTNLGLDPWKEDMTIRYNMDAETGLPHIYRHGVREGEVYELLQRPGAVTRGRRAAQLVLGQTRAGRYLKVICVPDEEGDGIFVISAYPLTGKALTAYRRRRRRQ